MHAKVPIRGRQALVRVRESRVERSCALAIINRLAVALGVNERGREVGNVHCVSGVKGYGRALFIQRAHVVALLEEAVSVSFESLRMFVVCRSRRVDYQRWSIF
jgi:hypothetical protein